jgi:glycosyltransferase involved in cell wall biosynthesis
VDLVCQDAPRAGPEDRGLLARYCSRIEVIHLSTIRSYLNCLQGLLGHAPLRTNYARSALMRRRVRQLAIQRRYVCAIAMHERMAQYLAASAAPLRILDAHDIVSSRHRRILALVRDPLGWAINFVEFLKMRRFERIEFARLDQVWLTTESELAKLRRFSGRGDVRVLPRGIDPADFRIAPNRVPNRVLFVADFAYWPNSHGARWFLEDVWPKVKQAKPVAECWLVGPRAPRWLSAWSQRDPSVRVTGRVPSVAPYLKQAAAFVSPLKLGGGVSFKVLEAMAAGCPIVSTEIGYRGTGAVSRQHLLLASTSSEFAAAVVRLLDRPDEAERMGRAATEFVARNHHFDVSARIAAAWIEEGLRRKTARNDAVKTVYPTEVSRR